MNRAEIRSKNLKGLFPNARIRLLKNYKTFHSEILLYEIGYFGRNNRTNKRVIVKYFNTTTFEEIKRQFEYQSRFSEKCTDFRISTPKPLYLDADNKMTVMEYVEGANLKHLLTKIKPVNKNYLNDLLDLTAISLAVYHKLFMVSETREIKINSPLLENNVIENAMKKGILLDTCGINFKVVAFLDFTPGNVIVEKQGKKISLIDFPQFESVSTPHLDLARFRFSLKIIKQYPILRFHISNWWTVDSVYDRFLEKYCQEMNFTPNTEDAIFIEFLEGEYARKLQYLYNSHLQIANKFRFRLTLEKYYMMPFLRNLLGSDKSHSPF